MKLIRHTTGYQPEHCNWKGYVAYVNGAMIAHDAFHHQPNESGTWEEELRAQGARLVMSPICVLRESSHITILEDWDEQYSRINRFAGYNDIPRIADYVFYLGNRDTCIKLLREGYEFGLTQSVQAYYKAKFFNYAKHSSDLYLNTKTGEICNQMVT